MIADDEPAVLDALAQAVAHAFGLEPHRKATGEEALDHLRSSECDLLITDMIMPGLSGLDLVRSAKQAQPSCDIIVMTAYPDSFPYMEVIEAGAADFLVKPHPRQELTAKIARIFRERALREALEADREQIRKDMKALRLQQAKRAFAERKYGLLFELSMNGMVMVDPETCEIQEANRAFCELAGRPAEALQGSSFEDLLRKSDRQRFSMGRQAMRRLGRGALADIRFTHPSGISIWVDVSLTYVESEVETTLLLACNDVSEQHAMEDQLVELASTDGLTGLLNQRAFHSRLDTAAATAEIHRSPLSLVLIDLDNFKQCNDTHGHQTGDALLAEVGRLIRRQIRSSDEGFRCGGDEFALILHGTRIEDAMALAERLRAAFAAMENFGTGMSLGTAAFEQGHDAKTLLKLADEALYRAKAQGKNAVVQG